MEVNATIVCTGTYCMLPGNCSNYYDQFDPIYFNFNGDSNYYGVPSTSYLFDGSVISYPTYCAIGVYIDLLSDSYILGESFLSNYYVVLDQDNEQIGLA